PSGRCRRHFMRAATEVKPARLKPSLEEQSLNHCTKAASQWMGQCTAYSTTGTKNLNDIWRLIPFENFVVTAGLTAEEIKSIMEEVYRTREPRALVGFEIEAEGRGANRRI